MRNHELAANLGVVVVAANLAMVKKVEQKTNLAKAIESIRAFEQQENIPEKYCRFFTQLCVAANEAELGGR